MSAREQTGDRELYRLVFAYNDFTNLLRESVNVIRHCWTICGNNVFRKHDVGGMSIRLVIFAGALVSSLNRINQVFLPIFGFVSRGYAASLRGFGKLSYSCSRSCSSLLCQDEFGQG